jgi:sigma-B regulation protein RsbU (phosphoserine phosphatase)
MSVYEQSNPEDIARKLDERLVELQSLFEMSQVLNASLQLDAILNNLLLTPMGRMMISKGMVLIDETSDSVFAVRLVKGLSRELLGTRMFFEAPPARPFNPSDVQQVATSVSDFFRTKDLQLVLPIVGNNDILGFVGLGPKLSGVPFSDSEVEYLSSLTNIAATALQNAMMFKTLRQVNRRLDKKVQELHTLFDIGKELNSTLDEDKVTNLLIYAIMGELMINRCFVFLRREDGLELTDYKGFNLGEPEQQTLQSEAVLQALALCSESIKISDNHLPKPLSPLKDLPFEVLVPMRIQNDTRGILLIGEKLTGGEFQTDEIEFLTTLANQAIIAIENARLFQESLEKQKIEDELNIARDIQRRLLPDSKPNWPTVDIQGLNIPSLQVGGDYYDIISMDDHRIAVVVADVSGKGVGASLLMANLQASIHSLIDIEADMTERIAKINNLIYAGTSYDKFITLFYGEYDTQTRTFRYINAGHNPPYRIKTDGSIQTLDVGGLLLGMMPNIVYESETLELSVGDSIVLFTDGVTEAKNPEDDEYGEDRLIQLLQNPIKYDTQTLIENIVESINDFARGAPQSDDVTIVGLEVVG